MTRWPPVRLSARLSPNAGRLATAVLMGVFGLASRSAPAQALVIDPFFDSSVTASQQTIIEDAISFYEHNFIDPITVSIEFLTQGSGGSSQSARYLAPYTNYTNSLLNDAQTNHNPTELKGYDTLGNGNQAQQIEFTSADGRALGCTT
jgi:hypothetical protein